MDRQLERLVRGDVSERSRILCEASDDLLRDILQGISAMKKEQYTNEELKELDVLNHSHNYIIHDLKSKKTPLKEKLRILQEKEVPWVIHKLFKLKRKQVRRRKNCPYPDCHRVGLLQLHNHLQQVHKIKDKTERQTWLDLAKAKFLADVAEKVVCT